MIMSQLERLDYLISYMQKEKDITVTVPENFDAAFEVFRGLANERPADAVTDEFIEIQDAFLKEYNAEDVTDAGLLTEAADQLYLWQGDITTLKADAIVNAANPDMLGCLIPNHDCIDNIIHTKAGVELRLECARIMEAQGRKEAVGRAKITSGYNLTADHVLHTVGPYVRDGKVSPMKADLLKKCYTSCLKLADQQGLKNIVFCSISTGVFGFPKEAAAKIAVDTVEEYLNNANSELEVIFNVFDDEDLNIYRKHLI
ncbi:protein-ADP-ribose hydrolase [Lacicoccus qingdaonensis]|uniref:O-acetyl-ADP-ribose deacetylase (Regulator of RNase III), contains Macro domain n=1 Tax=Lacicoccus qingdaonensis TaxID=576118 RepID=A0A1G9A720_9BACL|nr:O-acetyl-ADP-ribose deacetylase (regulator of RNase III), contains Macro domain [Salinicoccus qingdaonensis]